MNKRIKKIIENYFDEQISEKETKELIAWLKEGNGDLFNEYVILNFSVEQLKAVKNNKQHSSWTQLASKINDENLAKAIPIYRRNFFKYAATIILFVFVGYFYLTKNNSQINEPNIVNNNIEAGSDKAILTLENGSTVILEKGQQYVLDNIKSTGEKLIYTTSQTKIKPSTTYNYLTIPRGGQYHVILSDSTEVWLNSESKIKYPVSFENGKTRQVELIYGEAYFDVSASTKNNGAKFKVIHKKQEVEVLGTEFNIKAYSDENKIFTTLIEGVVNVNNGFDQKILEPNQQSIITDTSSKISVKTVNAKEVSSWKHGVFKFKDTSFKEILKVLSRWYNMDVVVVDKEIESELFTGTFGKEQNIEDILYLINKLTNIQYDINNKTIVFRK
ncbi:FecR family protein [Flavobacteriaceae bacterium F08102]|nr:FecR family protein [Flavobacteriaceae bacterium F08102]